MTFEELLTENGKHPEFVDFIYDLEKESEAWWSRMLFFNCRHQKEVESMTGPEKMLAESICRLVKEKWNWENVYNGQYTFKLESESTT